MSNTERIQWLGLPLAGVAQWSSVPLTVLAGRCKEAVPLVPLIVNEHVAPANPGEGNPSPMMRSSTDELAGAPVTVIFSTSALYMTNPEDWLRSLGKHCPLGEK